MVSLQKVANVEVIWWRHKAPGFLYSKYKYSMIVHTYQVSIPCFGVSPGSERVHSSLRYEQRENWVKRCRRRGWVSLLCLYFALLQVRANGDGALLKFGTGLD